MGEKVALFFSLTLKKSALLSVRKLASLPNFPPLVKQSGLLTAFRQTEGAIFLAQAFHFLQPCSSVLDFTVACSGMISYLNLPHYQLRLAISLFVFFVFFVFFLQG